MMRRRRYKLICRDEHVEDIHHILAYNFNPRLFNLAIKTGSLSRPIDTRELREWVNEEDGARVEIIHRFDDESPEALLVDLIYKLRENFISRRIDLNTFRRHIADLALLAMQKQLDIAYDILDLLSALECSMIISPSRTLHGVKIPFLSRRVGDEKSSYNETQQLSKNLKTMAEVRPEEMTRIDISVFERWKRIKGFPLSIKIIIPQGTENRKMELVTTTDEQGATVISAPRYSLIEIASPRKMSRIRYEIYGLTETPSEYVPKNNVIQLIAPNRPVRLTIWIERPVWIKYLILALSVISLIILALSYGLI